MAAIERDNPSLKGVLPRTTRPAGLDKQRLGQIINLVSDIALGARPTGPRTPGPRLRVLPVAFASAEGKKGGQFYTPSTWCGAGRDARPVQGPVYDPCCGSGGMFVQSEKFIEAHGGKLGDISIYGQESNYTTWRLAKMNLAIRGIDAQIGPRRHLPQRPAPRPQGRLRAGQPAVQRQRLARRAAQGRQALGLRRAAGGQRQLRLGAALHPPPGADGARGLRAGQRLDVVEPVGRGGDPQGDHRGRPGGLHGGAARASSSTRRRSRSASGSWPGTRRTAVSATGAARRSSSTRARWARWSTARIAS
jgi:hypothetical protein